MTATNCSDRQRSVLTVQSKIAFTAGEKLNKGVVALCESCWEELCTLRFCPLEWE